MIQEIFNWSLANTSCRVPGSPTAKPASVGIYGAPTILIKIFLDKKKIRRPANYSRIFG